MFSAINQDYNLLLSDDGEENQNTEVEDADNDDEVLALNTGDLRSEDVN